MPAHHQFPPSHNTGTMEWKSCGKRLSVFIEHCRIPASHNLQVCEEQGTLVFVILNVPAHHGNEMLQC